MEALQLGLTGDGSVRVPRLEVCSRRQLHLQGSWSLSAFYHQTHSLYPLLPFAISGKHTSQVPCTLWLECSMHATAKMQKRRAYLQVLTPLLLMTI
jgi:hypothetical protein